MDIDLAANSLQKMAAGIVLTAEPLSRHTSFRIGGPAAVYVQPDSKEALVRALNWVHGQGLPYFVLGQGTNVLVSDAGLDAVVISTARALRYVNVEDKIMVAGAGVLLTKLAHRAHRSSLAGMEFAISIPGTLGGALVMNAGAHGSEMRNIVQEIVVWQPGMGLRTLTGEDAEFSYRHSGFMTHRWIAIEAKIMLPDGEPNKILENMRHFMEYRKKTQPVGDPNAGSIFKNPLPDYAGRLIEEIGAKDWREGDAQVSPVHANFIVNRGKATAHDVLNLMRRIRAEVSLHFGVTLRPEVRWIGQGEGGIGATWENLWCEAENV